MTRYIAGQKAGSTESWSYAIYDEPWNYAFEMSSELPIDDIYGCL